MAIKHRLTIITSSKVEENDFSSLHLSRAKWVLPGGEYQRQDRFSVPKEVAEKLLGKVDTELVKEFAIQWGHFNNTIVGKRLEKKNELLAGLNNALLAKLVEPGYSMFIKPADDKLDAKRVASSFLQSVAKINDFGAEPANFISTPVAMNYFNNHYDSLEKMPKKLEQLLVDTICYAEEHKAECVELYSDLLNRATSVSVEYNNPHNPNSRERQVKNPENLMITVFWNTGSLVNTSTTVYKPLSDDIVHELGMFEIDHRASTVSQLNIYGMSAKLPVDLPPKTDDDGNILEPDEEKDHLVGSKTMFYAIPRHISIDKESQLVFNSSFKNPTGLHPQHEVKIKTTDLVKINTTSGVVSLEPPMNKKVFNCELFSYYRLPNTVFVDKNEYKQDRELELVGVWGETDLENPSYKSSQWGSDALFRIKAEARDSTVFDINKELKPFNSTHASLYNLKLHSRYQDVHGNAAYVNASIPKPDIFWACELSPARLEKAKEDKLVSESDALEYTTQYGNDIIYSNPLDMKTKLNMDGLFTDNTVFYHFTPEVESNTTFVPNAYFQDKFTIPKGQESSYMIVQLVTGLVVLGSVLYFVGKVYSGFTGKLVVGEKKETKEEAEEEKEEEDKK